MATKVVYGTRTLQYISDFIVHDCVCRVYSNFTLETILATAFGRIIDIQKGESDQFSKSMELLLSGFTDGQFEQFVLFHSKLTVTVSINYLAVLAILGEGKPQGAP